MNMRFMKMPKENGSLQDPFSLSVLGEREVSLVPCKRILKYEEGDIRIETVGCVVAVKGAGLSLKAYHEKEMRITGRIDSLAIERSC